MADSFGHRRSVETGVTGDLGLAAGNKLRPAAAGWCGLRVFSFLGVV